VSGARRLYLDRSPGEARGVVTLDGLPERLLIEREGVARGPRLGARYRARITEITPSLRLAYMDLGGGEAAAAQLPKEGGPARGATVGAEITAEARAGKAAAARLLGAAAGEPDLIAAAPTLESRLLAFAPDSPPIQQGEAAREAADDAEEAALQVRHELPGGLRLSVEPTAALTAVDLDWSGEGSSSARLKANLSGLAHAVRLLRLKALGGAAVVDLIGFPGREGDRLVAEARRLLEPDAPGVTVLPVSRLGLLQLARPHRETPTAELLCAADGRLSARSVAQRLVRALEREGRADPGARLTAVASPEVAAELQPLLPVLGPRYDAAAELGWDRLKTDIRRR
jgi:Ribonuclease G/E